MKRIVELKVFMTESDDPSEKKFEEREFCDLDCVEKVFQDDDSICVCFKSGSVINTASYTLEEFVKLWSSACESKVIRLLEVEPKFEERTSTVIMNNRCPDCGSVMHEMLLGAMKNKICSLCSRIVEASK